MTVQMIPFSISANTNTCQPVLIIENNYLVDFRPSHTINGFLWLSEYLCTEDFQESENIVNIPSIISLLVIIDIIWGSYINGSIQNTI